MKVTNKKLGYIFSLIGAAFLGGLTSVTALAAIPDNNSQINTCYNNITKNLRVTDVAGNCGGGYTSLSWDQSGWKGYAYVKANATLDIARSKNVTSSYSSSVATGTCFKTTLQPALVSATAAFGPVSAIARGNGFDSYIDSVCDSNTNVFVEGGETNVNLFYR